MRLLLEGKNGNKDMILEDVKEYNESVHDRKIYVSYNDDREIYNHNNSGKWLSTL